MRNDDVSLDNCLKCSDCNTVCPVLTAYPAYPGPRHLGPELERLRRQGLPCDTEWLEYCLGCHRCDLACPNQVNVSELIARAKARHVKAPLRRLRDFWFARPALLGKILSAGPGLTNRLLGLPWMRLAMARLMKITAERPFPPYARPAAAPPAAPEKTADRVVFFPGCAIRYNEPALGRTIRELLRRNGCEVVSEGNDCCGIPALANGDAAEAGRRARAVVQAMAAAADEGLRIVTACPSCGHMLKSGLAALLADDPVLAEKARRLAAATYDLGELLMERSDAGRLDTDFHQGPLRLAYHAPCHQRSQGIGRPWYHLLRQVPGVRIEDLDAGCCGMAGTFGFKDEKYPVSMAVGQRLFESIEQLKPQMVVTECATCRMQIEHGSGVAAIHPADLLLRIYGGTTGSASRDGERP